MRYIFVYVALSCSQEPPASGVLHEMPAMHAGTGWRSYSRIKTSGWTVCPGAGLSCHENPSAALETAGSAERPGARVTADSWWTEAHLRVRRSAFEPVRPS
jgi:hypothetical protein